MRGGRGEGMRGEGRERGGRGGRGERRGERQEGEKRGGKTSGESEDESEMRGDERGEEGRGERRERKRRGTFLVAVFDVGSAAQQQRHQFRVTAGAGQRQCRVVVAVRLRVQLDGRVDGR